MKITDNMVEFCCYKGVYLEFYFVEQEKKYVL